MPGFLDGVTLEPNSLEALRLELVRRGEKIIDLTQSNPTAAGLQLPPELLIRPAERFLRDRRYQPDPRGLPELRAEIRRYYAKRTPPLALGDERIFITASTSEAYSLLLTLLCDPGDAVYVQAPGYPLLDLMAAARHVKLAPYDGEHLPAARNARAIAVISPHNPLGRVARAIPEEFKRSGLPIICDEVFSEFTIHGEPTPPLDAAQPVFLLNGFSKMFFLPDLKIGWIALNAAAHERFGERLAVLNDSFLSAGSLNQHIAAALLQSAQDASARLREQAKERLVKAHARINRAPGCAAELPEAGAFLYVRYQPALDDEALALQLLQEEHVLVHPAFFYGSSESAFVISTIVDSAVLTEGLDRITRFFSSR